MLKSGTWPGNVAVEPLSDMDSSGSCDSVISTNSGCSDDSMEHLTPEERACLMFLEETIEALEVQEDSGLSNDELDPWTKTKHQIRVNGISSLVSQGMPAPPSPAAVVSAHMTLTPEGETEHHVLNQNSEPQSTLAPSPSFFGSTPGCTSPSAVNLTEFPGFILNGACDPENVTSTWTCCEEEPSEIDPSILPPPSDFMDELDADSQPEELSDVPAPSEFSTEPEPVQLNSTDSVKTISETSSLTEDPLPSPPPDAYELPPEFSPPISPPPVAPKPKKLPANIVLQSQKTAAGGSDGNARPLQPTFRDGVVENQQKVHTEALRKLGLLKENQEETGIVKNLKLDLKYRRSWTGSSPVSPAVPPTPPLTPSRTHLSSPPLAPPSPQSGTSPAVSPVSPRPPPPTQDSDVLPVPAAFSDSIRPLPSINKLPAGADVPDAAPPLTPPPTPPAPVQQLTSPKVTDVKPATPEAPGEGLSSNPNSPNPAKAEQSAIGEQGPQLLLSSQPRPASLGSRKDISCAKGEDLQAAPTASKQTDSQRSLQTHNVPQQSRESSKLPRSQGISVLICPRPENTEERREALRKLGLVRD